MRLPAALLIAGLIAPAAAGADSGWSYGGSDNGEDDWATLSPAYAACGVGTQQSPVGIYHTETVDLPPLVIAYGPSPAHARLIDYTLRVDIDGDNRLTIGGRVFRLKYLTLHTPGEHVVRDDFYPLEIELLHESADGHLLILSVLAKYGAANAGLQPLVDHAPSPDGGSDFTFNPVALLPAALGYWAYSGSLTTPPCTEGVEWRILRQPVEMTKAQLKGLTRLFPRNARTTQPIYMRSIQETPE